jgi:DNA-binding transcriptional LysR family regulator
MRNLNSVHLNGLRALEAVGRLGSLQAAAEELGVSVGAVSQQVIKAEAQLDHLVFERTPKGMVRDGSRARLVAGSTEGFARLSQAVAAMQRRDDSILTCRWRRSSRPAGWSTGSTASPNAIPISTCAWMPRSSWSTRRSAMSISASASAPARGRT